MGNITGNQDLVRFISLASGAISFSEDDKKAGWERDIQIKDTIGYRKLASLLAFNMTIPGIPIIYYGDEIGMPGGGDPDNRRMMRFDSLNQQEKNLKGLTARLGELRRNSMALLFGDFTVLKVTDRLFVYSRSYFDEFVVVAFNKDREPRKIEFDMPEEWNSSPLQSRFGAHPKVEGRKVTLTLPGNSFDILTK
jgi:glycosidase